MEEILTIRLSKSKLRITLFLFALLLILVSCGGTDAEEIAESDIPIPIDFEFVYVPASSFYMGSTEADVLARDDEFPKHILRMDGFWMWKREVSNYQYSQCVDAGECSGPTNLGDGPSEHYGEARYANNPVVGVTWYQAAEYCEWADGRMPTEAEWEKTARGDLGQPYPWGEDSPNCDLTNMVGCFEDPPDTDQIGQYPDGASEHGALDLIGNVWEWVSDWYGEDYYPNSPSSNPTGPDLGEYKVLRGGSYEDDETNLRAAARFAFMPDEMFNNVGFRCVPLGLSSPAQAHAPFCQDTYIPYCRTPGDDCTPSTSTRTGEDCPEMWHYDTLSNRCEPDEGGCPPTTTYSYLQEGCEPTDGDCPQGWIYDTSTETCQPTDGGCPQTTAYATNLNGCEPDNGTDCPDGWYYDTGRESCQPSGGGCPEGTYYDTLEQGCVPNNNDTDCPDGYYYDTGYETCMPAGTTGSGQTGGISVLGFGCPDGSQVTFTLDVGDNPSSNYQVTVDNENFNCVVDPSYPDRLICTGPAQAEGTYANIVVCPPGANSNIAQAQNDSIALDTFVPTPSAPETGISLVAYENQVVELTSFVPIAPSRAELSPFIQTDTNPNGINGYCPEGYEFNKETGECRYPETGDNCPEGWHYDTLSYQCEPDDEGGCPQGTYYDTSNEGCVPENGDCPEGYYFDTQTETCEPPGNNDGGMCPMGYFYDTNIHCCSPITTTITQGCELGYYYDTELQRCLPTDDYGCGPNLTYNPYEGACVPMYDNQDDCEPNSQYQTHLSTCVEEETSCPDGYILASDGYTCEPQGTNLSRPSGQSSFQTGPDCRQPGYVMNELGYCEPEGSNGDQGDCGPNGYYDTLLQRCVTPGDGDGDEDCGPGYYYDRNQESCRPTGGPGSGCGYGFAYYPGLNCCVPTPGNDGTFCPGDFEGGPTAGGDGGQTNGLTTFSAYSSPNNSEYDYGRGYCDPGDNGGDCPPGYHSDTPDGSCVPYNQGGDCPEGYHSDTIDGSCAPFNTSATSAIESVTLIAFNSQPAQQNETDCPSGYYHDSFNGGCLPEGLQTFGDDCGEGYYYDYEMNFCVPATCDDCAIGFYNNGEVCVPYDRPDCPEMWHYDTLNNRCEPDEGGCPQGTYYDTLEQGCVPTDDECPENWQYATAALTTCEPQDGGCPEGTYYDTLRESCVPDTGTDCPEGWYYDTALQYCQPSDDGCPRGTYYDTLEQGCVPDNNDTDCPDGYYYDAAYETCMPDGGDEPQCPLGYDYDARQQTCIPHTGDGGEGCQTITIAIPVCTQPGEPTGDTTDPDGGRDDCPFGYQENANGNCEVIPADSSGPKCSSYTASLACGNAGCNWVNTGTPPNYGYCRN